MHVCLVFMCTRVDMCINKHFSFKIFLLKPLFEKFLDLRLYQLFKVIFSLMYLLFFIYSAYQFQYFRSLSIAVEII